MKSQLRQLFAVGALVSPVLSWKRDEPSWHPPRKTGTVKHSDSGVDPIPTAPAGYAPPAVHGRAATGGLVSSTQDICGYVYGQSSLSFGCNNAYCYEAVNLASHYSFVDCCGYSDVNSCTAATTCLDSTNAYLAGTTSTDRTYLCTDSQYPYCITYLYQDIGYVGFTWLDCGTFEATMTVYHTATDTSTSAPPHTTPSSTGAASSPISTTSSSASSSSPTPTPSGGGGGTPVGPIVGGVVGGVGGLVLFIGAIIFAYLRHKRKNNDAPTDNNNNIPPGAGNPQMAGAFPPHGGAPGGDPQMMYGGPTPPIDPNKPVYYAVPSPDQQQQQAYLASNVSGSPPPHMHPDGSPVSGYDYVYAGQQQHQYPEQSPVSFQQVQYGEQHPQHLQQQQQHDHYSELPAARGDGELRELA